MLSLAVTVCAGKLSPAKPYGDWRVHAECNKVCARRYGKLIPYIDSEQRIDDLLSTLCGSEGVDKAVELMQVCGVTARPQLLTLDQAPEGLRSFLGVQVNRTAEGDSEQLPWEWVPLAGGPKGMGTGTRKLPANEAKTSKRELGVFCESLLEKHEEQLVKAIRAETPEQGNRRSGACRCSLRTRMFPSPHSNLNKRVHLLRRHTQHPVYPRVRHRQPARADARRRHGKR